MENITDITIEVFNRCGGSCPGCALSVSERQTPAPVMSPQAFDTALGQLVEHGKQQGVVFRPVLSFGDLPLLPAAQLATYLDLLRQHKLSCGLTMTFANDGVDRHYQDGLDLIARLAPDAVFDLTVDPLRLLAFPDYGARLRDAIARAAHVHAQVLLSRTLMERLSAETLAKTFSNHLPGQPLAVVFTPSLDNLAARERYRYDTESAAQYARTLLRHLASGTAFAAAESQRFSGSGSYRDFARHAFHIGPDLGVFPVAYSAFGDVIMDRRNGGTPWGFLSEQPLATILESPRIATLSVHNRVALASGPFDCESCPHHAQCAFHGVGLVRRLYRDWETRLGACHGPRSLWVDA